MRRWQSHKLVEAAKIIVLDPAEQSIQVDSGVSFDLDGEVYERIRTMGHRSTEQVVGGYFVRYADGHESWSPPLQFLDGYTRVAGSAEKVDNGLQSWRSHKIVLAGLIESVIEGDDAEMYLELDGGDRVVSNERWMVSRVPGGRNDPQVAVGGYYVEYEDGYSSWCPAETFLAEHTEFDEVVGTPV